MISNVLCFAVRLTETVEWLEELIEKLGGRHGQSLFPLTIPHFTWEVNWAIMLLACIHIGP